MSQHILKKPVMDAIALEKKIQRRLRRGKTRLFLVDILYLILAMTVIFFVI